MQPPAAPAVEPGASDGDSAITAHWGESLRLVATDHRTVAHCAHCDAELGPLRGDWRRLAGTVELAAEELGPLVQLPADLVGRQYVCPSCATALWVEVVSAEGAGWTDFRLQ